MQQYNNFDIITRENIKEHNPFWPKTSDASIQNVNNWKLWIRKSKCVT